jgi:hypothetical protein
MKTSVAQSDLERIRNDFTANSIANYVKFIAISPKCKASRWPSTTLLDYKCQPNLMFLPDFGCRPIVAQTTEKKLRKPEF